MQSVSNILTMFLIILSFLPTKSLLSFAGNAKNPRIVTNEDGKYVYAIWAKNNSIKDIIQVSISSDYAQTWSIPQDISASGENANMPYIANDMYQRFIYGTWARSNGTYDIIQFSYSKTDPFHFSSPINLSKDGQNAYNPKIATAFIGKNIYAIWARSNGTYGIIQFCKSTDFGKTFSNVIDLSDSGFSATNQQLSVNKNQSCICSIWQRSNGLNDIIQFRNSLNLGNTWNNIVDLSTSGQDAKNPQIKAANNMIYAIWVQSNGTNDIIQMRASNSSGNNWLAAVDLSTPGQNAKNPQITTDQTGQNAYAIWARSNGTNDIIQMSHTSDFGSSWSSPIDLSAVGQNAKNPQILSDDIGQNIYAIWIRSNGTNDIIQESHSNDFGATWSAATNLSDAGQDAKNPQISISTDGMKIYVVWTRSNGINDVVQISSSQFYGSFFSAAKTISN